LSRTRRLIQLIGERLRFAWLWQSDFSTQQSRGREASARAGEIEKRGATVAGRAKRPNSYSSLGVERWGCGIQLSE
jgi:hypothetical protein